jgi:myo-inositol-1(or 4)-monophosphatase
MTSDLELIVQAALEGGDIALRRRDEGLEVWNKPGDSPVSSADLEVDGFLAERLLGRRADYGWLSEETADNEDRLGKRRLFVVDPIDGTRAYIKGRPWFAVSIAIVEGGRPVAGVVHAPELRETFVAEAGGGATLNGKPIAPSGRSALEGMAMLGDKALFAHPSWPTPWPAMRIESRNSIAYRLCLVASGAFDAAFAPSGKSDWDLAAADLIATEAGAVICDVKGRPFVYNRPVPKQAGLVCAGPALAPLILEHLAPIQWPTSNPA